jgi:hypothetical protein
MATTLLLDQTTWDLVLDANGNIAVASAPYQLAQDAASACKTFLGECWYDTTVGVPYWSILGLTPPLPLIKHYLVEEAMTVPGVVAAQVFLTAVGTNRILSGQVQVTSIDGVITMASF